MRVHFAIKEKIIKLSRKMIRSFEYEQEFDTLFYFLNNYFDIREAKPATGPLRDLQKCDSMLLSIFHEVCKRNNLNYWIDSGTLLGQYRHGGFIPWDDDLDVCMLRCDYDRAKELLPGLLGKYGIVVKEFSDYPMACFGVGYKHEKTGIWQDVYPVDSVNDVDENKASLTLENNLWKYKKYYLKNKNSKSLERVTEKKEKLIRNGLAAGEDELLFLAVEYDYNKIIMNNKNNVFPLKQVEFEGVEVNAPNRVPEYLKSIYGDNYMQFPRNGVAHHGGNNGKLYEWASNSATDMNEIYEELKKIYSKVVEEKAKDNE